jgi:hypothetical protein
MGAVWSIKVECGVLFTCRGVAYFGIRVYMIGADCSVLAASEEVECECGCVREG